MKITKTQASIDLRRKKEAIALAEEAARRLANAHGHEEAMNTKRKDKLLEENILCGRRSIPAAKQFRSAIEIVKGLSASERSRERASIINNIKQKLYNREAKTIQNKSKIKPLRAQESYPRYTYSNAIDKDGKTTRSTERRRFIIVDSASQLNLVRDKRILNMLKARNSTNDRLSVKGFTSPVSTKLTIAAPLIFPFNEIEAYHDENFPENILAMETLEKLFEVSIVKEEDKKYLHCVNNITGDVIRCFRDSKASNFYTYNWDDDTNAVCFKMSSTLNKAQGMGLSKVAAVRALEVEAIHRALSHV